MYKVDFLNFWMRMKIFFYLILMCGIFIIKYFLKFINFIFEFIFMYFLEKIYKFKMIILCVYEKSNLVLLDGCYVLFVYI